MFSMQDKVWRERQSFILWNFYNALMSPSKAQFVIKVTNSLEMPTFVCTKSGGAMISFISFLVFFNHNI